ncbi:MAG TPA: hypothetical protein VJN21_00745 [Candidatus Acidoferrales bacterium]|nr:hypothetical protein [Candidatus Acidoferrales bacterium]
MQKNAQQRRLQDRRIQNVLARSGGSCCDENAAADDGANAERCETQPAERFLQPAFGILGIRNQLINALGAEELSVQSAPPSCRECCTLH